MTTLRIQASKSVGFEWVGYGAREDCTRDSLSTIWEAHLSELAEYCKITGTAMFLGNTAKTPTWLIGSQTNGSTTGKERHRL
jgi:hypothetical protein